MPRVLTLDEVDLTGKRVLSRVDINSPIHPETGELMDDTRLRRIVPTLDRLYSSRVILMAHQSRPGKRDCTSLVNHAKVLERLIRRPVTFVDGLFDERVIRAIHQLLPGEVLLLENVRFFAEEVTMKKSSIEELASSQTVTRLAPHVDVYLNDAFAASHRSSPTLAGFAHVMPCIAGELMGSEVKALNRAIENPEHPSELVVGGAKVDDSVAIIANMLSRNVSDSVWVCGAVGNLFIEAKGLDLGAPSHDFLVKELGDSYEATLSEAKRLLSEYKERIQLPFDVAIDREGARVDITLDALPVDYPILDIGVKTIQKISSSLISAGTIVWNGPAGKFEQSGFGLGTHEIVNACVESNGYSVMGGGETSSVVAKRELTHRVGHMSTGGGALLNYLAGKPMPVIEALEASAAKYWDKLADFDLAPQSF